MHVRYLCAHCGEYSPIRHETDIDSGTTLTCEFCEQKNVFDIDQPEVRARRFGFVHVEPPNFEDMCMHQAPMKPPGVVGFMHPITEKCHLRESIAAREEGRCYFTESLPELCTTHDCQPAYPCRSEACPHCNPK